MDAHIVVRNIRSRVVRLYTAIENGDNSFDNIQYRLDSLCRDIRQYREYICNYEYISNNLLLAKRTIDTAVTGDASDHDTCSSFRPDTTRTSAGVGRPKYNITSDQLRFFIGKITSILAIIHYVFGLCN